MTLRKVCNAVLPVGGGGRRLTSDEARVAFAGPYQTYEYGDATSYGQKGMVDVERRSRHEPNMMPRKGKHRKVWSGVQTPEDADLICYNLRDPKARAQISYIESAARKARAAGLAVIAAGVVVEGLYLTSPSPQPSGERHSVEHVQFLDGQPTHAFEQDMVATAVSSALGTIAIGPESLSLVSTLPGSVVV